MCAIWASPHSVQGRVIGAAGPLHPCIPCKVSSTTTNYTVTIFTVPKAWRAHASCRTPYPGAPRGDGRAWAGGGVHRTAEPEVSLEVCCCSRCGAREVPPVPCPKPDRRTKSKQVCGPS